MMAISLVGLAGGLLFFLAARHVREDLKVQN